MNVSTILKSSIAMKLLVVVLIVLTGVVIELQGTGISRRYKNSKSLVKDIRQNGFYDFHYLIDHENSHQYRKETRKNGKVTGSYGIIDPDGRKRMVYYIADEDGFRAKVDTNEPGVLSINPANVEMTKSENIFNNLMKAPQDETSTSFPDTTQMNSIDYHQATFYNDVDPYVYPLPSISKSKDGGNNLPVMYSVHINHDKENSWDSYSPNNVNPYGYSSNSWKLSNQKKSQA